MIKRGANLGFELPQNIDQAESAAYDEMRKKLMDSLRRTFRPEFINRVDAIIVFRSLTKSEITEIVDLLMDRVRERVAEYNIAIELTDAAKGYIAEEGYDPEFGARPLRRVIQNRIEDALSDGLLAGDFADGSTVVVDYVDGALTFSERSNELTPTA